MNSKVPFSILKYSKYLRTIKPYFFGDKKKSYAYTTPKLLGNTYFNYANVANTKIYSELEKINLGNSELSSFNKTDILSLISKFESLPAVPKTYLNRKKANYYLQKRTESKNMYAQLDVDGLNELYKIYNNSNTYLYTNQSRYLRDKISSADLASYSNTNNIGSISFRHTDFSCIDLEQSNFLKNKIYLLNDEIKFTANLTKEISVINLKFIKDKEQKENILSPDQWKDYSKNSKRFFLEEITDLTPNSSLAILTFTLNFNTVNYHTFFRAKGVEFDSLDKNSRNQIQLDYFFYEFFDFQSYI